MKQLTIRGFDDEVAGCIQDLSRRMGISMNQAVLRLIRKGAGLDHPRGREDRVGRSLDHLIGTWDNRKTHRMTEALEVLEGVDDSMWR